MQWNQESICKQGIVFQVAGFFKKPLQIGKSRFHTPGLRQGLHCLVTVFGKSLVAKSLDGIQVKLTCLRIFAVLEGLAPFGCEGVVGKALFLRLCRQEDGEEQECE